MNVRQLIEKLQKIEDDELEVFFLNGNEMMEVNDCILEEAILFIDDIESDTNHKYVLIQ